MRTLRYQIFQKDEGKTVEQYLREQGISRRVIIALKKHADGMLLNGAHIRTIDPLHSGDLLEINLSDSEKRMPLCDIPVPILYENEDIIIYNKPHNMPCHQSGGHIFGTLSGVYAAHCAQTGIVTPFRAVNRLDKDTTGAVVAAKNQIAAGKLWKTVDKVYLALVEGIPQKKSGVIRLPIERERPYEMKRVVDPDGQEAITEYHLLAQGENCALIACILYTGRTHQIRVHFSYLGHPLLGDELYGGRIDQAARQMLHCAAVSFPDPLDGCCRTVYAPLPEDMRQLLSGNGICFEPQQIAALLEDR